jgi:Fic family protein
MKTILIKQDLLQAYKNRQPITLRKHLTRLKDKNSRTGNFGYHLSLASVYSSMIEGNPIDHDSYLRYVSSGINVNRKSFREIQDLIEAYRFATVSALNARNLLKAHQILSANLLEDPAHRGTLRDRKVFIYGQGKKIYEGTLPEQLEAEMTKFFKDLGKLVRNDLSVNEVFYYASMIHLTLVKMHPFADGNGRTARLVEKWFIARKIGISAWMIPSEKLYQRRLRSYYRRLDLGPDYNRTNWSRAFPFLLLLPMALTAKS